MGSKDLPELSEAADRYYSPRICLDFLLCQMAYNVLDALDIFWVLFIVGIASICYPLYLLLAV